ncbi:MAG: hypothetical protein B7Z08_03970 [Sphingomonadales bacterium 32-68-7]|nr:MAG: hypothetical protein B7Z08_03970 [Sphingomonadales bacterium 32-68-7]
MPTSTTSGGRQRTMGQRELVVLIALLMSLNALAIDGMLPALDEMAREMGVIGGNRRQLVVAVYLLANGIGCLVPGALLTAGLMVVPTAIIRDQYEGDRMARLMSLVSAVFIAVPVVAPSLGQAVLLFAGWRWIFVLLAALSLLGALWTWMRLPETLDPANRQRIDVFVIVRNMKVALINRASIGYVLGTMLLIGAVFGYVNSAQQLIGEHFGAGDAFPIVFGGTATVMVISNIVNSRIVERFGARRVSHSGVFVFIGVALAQVWAAHFRPDSLYWFMPLMATNLALLGFLGANFGSIAMQPFAAIAGAASSIQTFFRMFGAAVVGLIIGQAYDGTARPLAHALLICSVSALLLVSYSERGRLFRRLNGPHTRSTSGPNA